ncbi:MAG: LamG-like jellyroll fold domain-containing protein [Cyclobacteriaceae bacterium]
MKLRIALITAVCMIGIYLSHSLPYLNGSELPETSDNSGVDWIVAYFFQKDSIQAHLNGSPKIAASPYGQSVAFDGVDDAIFIEGMPLDSLESFTIEMVFYPEKEGPFEQRVVHIGEVFDDRMLLEIRAVDDQWYFDGFVSSAGNNKALIDENLTHPLGQWYHVALVVTPEVLQTYVNGMLELEEPYAFKGIQTGRSSIGVRLNKISWFKGIIHRVRITPGQLDPSTFVKL